MIRPPPRIAAIAVQIGRGSLIPSTATRWNALKVTATRSQSTDATQPSPVPAEPEPESEQPKKRKGLGIIRGTLTLVLLSTAAYYGTALYQSQTSTSTDPLLPLPSAGPSQLKRETKKIDVLPKSSLPLKTEEKETKEKSTEPKQAPVVPAPAPKEPKREPEPVKEEEKAPPKADAPPKTAPSTPKPAPAPTPVPAPREAAPAPSPPTQSPQTSNLTAEFLDAQLDLFGDLPALPALTLQVEALKDYVKQGGSQIDKNVLLEQLSRLAKKIDALENDEVTMLKEALDDQAENFSSLLEEGKQKALGEQRESLAAEARERLSELESKLQEAEEAASMYAKLSETVSKSVEALKAEAEENARELANYFQTVAKDTVERERSDRIAVLRDMALKMELLEKHRDDNVEGSQKIAELQKLHGAVNALGIALHSGSFKKELDILAKLGENNAVVKSCVDMVADTAATGVLSDFELERRFVEGVRGAAIRAGRMPEGGGVGSYFLSAVAGVLPFAKKTEADFIIEQAEKLLKAGDVEGAAREVNQLKGWAKVAAKDWLEAARRKVKANYAHDLLSSEVMIMLSEVG